MTLRLIILALAIHIFCQAAIAAVPFEQSHEDLISGNWIEEEKIKNNLEGNYERACAAKLVDEYKPSVFFDGAKTGKYAYQGIKNTVEVDLDDLTLVTGDMAVKPAGETLYVIKRQEFGTIPSITRFTDLETDMNAQSGDIGVGMDTTWDLTAKTSPKPVGFGNISKFKFYISRRNFGTQKVWYALFPLDYAYQKLPQTKSYVKCS